MFWCKSKLIKSWLPRLQSHRGYWIEGLTQNSLESISKSFELDYQMVEFDVRLTKDKVAILFHDNEFLHKKINLYTFEELSEFVNVVKLQDILSWLAEKKNENLKLNIELKSNVVRDNSLESIVIALVRKFNLQKQIIISSFNPFSLMRVRFIDKEIFRALLLSYESGNGNYWFLRSRIFNFLAYPHALNLRYQDWIAFNNMRIPKDIPIVLWTLNDYELCKDLFTKVHGIISDKIIPDDFKN